MAKFMCRDIIAVSEPIFCNTEPVPRYIGSRHYVAIVSDVWFTKSHVGWYTLTIVAAAEGDLAPRAVIKRLMTNIDKRAHLYEGH